MSEARLEQLFENALALSQHGRTADAEAGFRQLLSVAPDHGEGHHRYGLLLAQTGRGDAALAHLAQAEALLPGRTDIKINFATVCQHRGDAGTALRLLEAARALGADQAELFYNLGIVYQAHARYADAAEAFAGAAERRPEWAEAVLSQSHCLLTLGEVPAARGLLALAVERFPGHPGIASNHLLALNYDDNVSAGELAAAHRTWGNLVAVAGALPPLRSAPNKRLRIGFVSPNLSEHAVAFFFEALVAHLPRARCETFAYPLRVADDAVSKRLQARIDRWRVAEALDDDALAQLITNDRVDILVDLAGHTARSRIALFARRLAPVQVSMIGYPTTTGLSAIDYCISDATLDPPAEEGRGYVEKVHRLPLFCAYRPPESRLDPNPLPLLARGAPTFGCFQSLAKLSTPTLAAWRELFAAQPGARLLIKALGTSDWRDQAALRHRLAAAGLPVERVDIEGFGSFDDFLAAHHRVDLCLDTLPWNGHTTTCHSLWMGVPTLSLVGDRRAGRMGKALLDAVGLPQFAVGSADELVSAAHTALADPAMLAEVRSGLRATLLASPLCDGAGYARQLASFFEQAYAAATGP